jgi:hypothetical protein
MRWTRSPLEWLRKRSTAGAGTPAGAHRAGEPDPADQGTAFGLEMSLLPEPTAHRVRAASSAKKAPLRRRASDRSTG